MLETVALWWCYVTGATVALGIYGIIAIWAVDQFLLAFKVQRTVLEWWWEKQKARRHAERSAELRRDFERAREIRHPG